MNESWLIIQQMKFPNDCCTSDSPQGLWLAQFRCINIYKQKCIVIKKRCPDEGIFAVIYFAGT